MSSLTDNQDAAAKCSVPVNSSYAIPSAHGPVFSDPLFLMVNTLETGGTERQFVQMARALRADGVPVHVGCVSSRGAMADGLGEIDEFPLGGSLYGWQSLRSRWRLKRHLRKMTVAVAHAFDFYANLTLIPAAKLARVPVVIGSHRQLGDLMTPLQFRAQLEAFRLCDRVVCNSRAAAGRLIEAGFPQRKVVVIGNALPLEAFAAPVRALARVNETFRIGMIARMNAEYKNHRGFLRAAITLSQKFSNVEFVLVGDGPLRSDLERQVLELGLECRVQFLGDRRDIPAVLASLDVSVVPSFSESASNVMLESMAAGVPVVATAVGGSREIGDDGRALLVPSKDEDALARGLTRIVEDAAFRSAMARRALEFVRANFSVEQVCRQYEQLYADVLTSRRQRSSSPHGVRSWPDSERAVCVAFVAPTLRYVGGQAVQADLLMRRWKGDPDIAARFVPVDPSFPPGLGWAERVFLLRTILRQPLYMWRLWQELKKVDVAHIFSASYFSFLLAPLPAWFVARMLGKKTIINYRSGEARDHLQRSWIAQRVLRRTDRLVVPSGYLVDVFRKFGLKAQAIPNIVDVSQFSFRLRQPLRPHLVCTRGFHPYYCVDVVVRAFAEVQKVFPEAQLDLVGGGPLETEIRELVRNLKLSGVAFKGVAPREEIGRHYDHADIFINASRLDNMPVSVLEAFASGTPVISTEPDSMRYVVEHGRTGLLSPVGDARALAENVIRVLRDAELAQRLASNAHRQMEGYSWPVVREQWLEVYRAMTSAARSGENSSGL